MLALLLRGYRTSVNRLYVGFSWPGAGWPDVVQATLALVGPTLSRPGDHRRLIRTIQWLVALIFALMLLVLMARLPMGPAAAALVL